MPQCARQALVVEGGLRLAELEVGAGYASYPARKGHVYIPGYNLFIQQLPGSVSKS